ncbi:MAG: TadG family pilus assembly protein [Thermodesulfobacteriota bacterium]
MGERLRQRKKGEQGVTAVVVALLMAVFIGMAAFAIDIGHLYVVKNELQNAADAGCLAGTRFLYDEDGASVNEWANEIAYETAVANRSENLPVEVHWSGGNTGDVQRGHWSFSTRTFTPSDNMNQVAIWDVSPEELDADPNFVNAIQVRTRRQDAPAASFFARVFGYENFFLSAEAIAYVGFAGMLAPGEVDQPLAVCKESLLIDGKYTCSTGRMISNHEWLGGQESGGWTDFNQDNPCDTGVNAGTVRSLICGGGNPDAINVHQPVAIHGGYIQYAHGQLRDCWEAFTGKTRPWTVTLPVIECPGNSVGSCASVVGAVTVHIVWVTNWQDDPTYSDAPRQMENPRTGTTWYSNNSDGQVRWNQFVQAFNLRKVDGSPVPYQRRGVYFLPDCNPHPPRGRTGGENFGILAKIPVLVK